MHLVRRTSLLLAALAVGAASTAVAPVASADHDRPPRVANLAEGLVTPLSLAVSRRGTVYYSENFKGTLLQKRPGRAPQPIHQDDQGREVGAVSERNGVVTFAVSTEGNQAAVLMRRTRGGQVRQLADLGAHEATRNPDAGNTYGLVGLDPTCAAQLPPELLPATYTGIVETHPYATAMTGRRHGRTTYVADAAGNAILGVSPRGRVRTVAVLPPQPAVVTADAATANGFPDCVVGKTYSFEAVPTDVETGPDGHLYVTTLPGGPEDPSLGLRASVYRVNPWTGRTSKVARNLLSATGLAVADNGDLYVAELFGNRIVKIRAGRSIGRTYVDLPMPSDVDLRGRHLYAGADALVGGLDPSVPPGGRIVRLRR